MPRSATIAVAITVGVAMAILFAGLLPPDYWKGSIKRDGPLVHILSFAVLVLPLTAVWPRRVLLIVLVSVLFGVAIEWLQGYVGRAPQFNDIGANLVGALAGGAGGFLFSRQTSGKG